MTIKTHHSDSVRLPSMEQNQFLTFQILHLPPDVLDTFCVVMSLRRFYGNGGEVGKSCVVYVSAEREYPDGKHPSFNPVQWQWDQPIRDTGYRKVSLRPKAVAEWLYGGPLGDPAALKEKQIVLEELRAAIKVEINKLFMT